MRDFFKQILSNLYIYCGNRQVDKMTDEEIKALLDSLERLSKIYGYIPEEKQKEIILTCLVSDRDYQNINVRTVSKWFEQNGKTYFKEVAHKPIEPTAEPLTGEEREKWLEVWKRELAKMEEMIYPDRRVGSGTRLREQLNQVAPIPTTSNEDSALNDYCNEQALNKQGSEGTIENTGLSENNPDTPQPDENFSQQRENI